MTGDTVTRRLRSRLFPLLSKRGASALTLLLLPPLVALLGEATTRFALAGSSCVALLLAVLLIREFRLARRFLSSSTFRAALPARAYSNAPLSARLHCSFPALGVPYHLCLRVEPIPETKTKTEIHSRTVPAEGAEITFVHELTPLGRDDIALERVYLRFSVLGRLALWQTAVPLPEVQNRCAVFPNPSLGTGERRRSVQKHLVGSTSLALSHGGEGKDFDSLRLYTPHDDLRRVDWKRSAKRSTLVVKHYRPESHQRIYVVLDCSRRMSTTVDERLQFDHAIDAAAHVVQLAVESDDEVGLYAFHCRELAALDARRGRSQQELLMETLRELKPNSLEPDYRYLRNWALRLRKRSLLIIFTSASMPAGLDDMRHSLLHLAHHHLPLVIAIHDRDLRRMYSHPPANVRDAFVTAAAYQQFNAIDQRLRTLNRSGIPCVHHDVRNLAAVIERKYFELKLEGRW